MNKVNEKVTTFISLGPTCLGAEILKAGRLRDCTYGFDWVRSGGYFIFKFFEMEHELFIDKYVVDPCVPLLQNENPALRADLTVNPEPINPIYGFPYIYTPHRDYRELETRDYLVRSFTRLANQLKKNEQTVFLVCDYENKQGCIYLDNWKTIAKRLESIICKSKVYRLDRFDIIFLRIKLLNEEIQYCKYEVSTITNLSTLMQIDAPLYLDEKSTRNNLYEIVAKVLTHRFQ